MSPEPLYWLDASRSAGQSGRMEELAVAGICIFCPEGLASGEQTPVEHRGTHWYVKQNDFPYAGTAAHYLIIPHRHVTSFDELPDDAGAELWAIRRELKQQLGPPATATVERSGAMWYNGSSVAHLHVHFVTMDEIPAQPVRFRVSGKSEPDWAVGTASRPAVSKE